MQTEKSKRSKSLAAYHRLIAGLAPQLELFGCWLTNRHWRWTMPVVGPLLPAALPVARVVGVHWSVVLVNDHDHLSAGVETTARDFRSALTGGGNDQLLEFLLVSGEGDYLPYKWEGPVPLDFARVVNRFSPPKIIHRD
jgi:hypothetical protein